jgi:hypothetical protein
MRYVIDVLAVIGALWIAGTVFFAVSDTIKGNQIECEMGNDGGRP